jgi:hypothetical protein
MNNIFKKTILVALAAALVFAAFPVTSVFAQGENPPKGELTNEKLEQIWARQLKTHERLGKAFDDIDGQIAKFQARIDKAAANGKDVTAFEASSKSAKPIYDSMSGIVNSHQGFDANGKVIDSEKAKSTVQDMRAKLKELKSAMGGTGKALREALKAFREANKPADNSGRGT